MATWMYFLHPPRENFAATMTPDEERFFGEHFTYLQKLLRDGALLLAGPTLGLANTGLCIVVAPDKDAGRRIMNHDPAIAQHVVSGELREFRVSLLADPSNWNAS